VSVTFLIMIRITDHLQTCQSKSPGSRVHDWVVYKLGVLLGSVGHSVKIHKITLPGYGPGKERLVNNGLHCDPYSFWVIKFVYYRTTHKLKSFRLYP
jgi:hypothetical protein